MFSTFCKVVGRPAFLTRPLIPLRLASSYDREVYLERKSDPKTWESELLRSSIYKRNRYIEDLEYRNKVNSIVRARHKRLWKKDGPYRRISMMAKWIRMHAWVREQLPWKSHRPVLYPQKVVRSCTRCNVTRRDGLKIWWESIESEDHICHACYAKADWNEVLPEGFEDCRTMKDLGARMQQLSIGKPKKVNATERR